MQTLAENELILNQLTISYPFLYIFASLSRLTGSSPHTVYYQAANVKQLLTKSPFASVNSDRHT